MMEHWFEKRRKIKVLDIAYRQITLALDTVNDLERSVKAASTGDKDATRRIINRLFEVEEEIDNLRRKVFEELTRGSLKSKDREDIMHLVKRLDVMADHVKDSARNILVLIGYEIPREIWDAYIDMADRVVKCASILRQSLKELSRNPHEARQISLKVEDEEGRVDEKYIEIKSLFLKFGDKMNPSVLLILRDLVESMEEVADTCADTADYVRVLTVSFK